MGAVVALRLSAPKSYSFEAVATSRWTKFGKSSGVGLSFSVLHLDGRAFESVRREFRDRLERFPESCRHGGTWTK